MNYKIVKVFDINYPQVINNFERKQNCLNLNYSVHLKKFLDEYNIETPGFSKKMLLMGNPSNDIIYNYYDLQIKWQKENNISLDQELSFQDKLYFIFEKQISHLKPEIIFFRTQPLFDSKKIINLKEKFKFIKKIICHNGFPSKNLKNIDLIFSSSPALNDFYKNQGLKSTLLYHSFDENILSKVNNNTKKDNIIFCGQTGDTKSAHYKTRFDYLNDLLSHDFPINCHSSEFFENPNKIISNNLKQNIRNSLIKLFGNKLKSTLRKINIKLKNNKIYNFIEDINTYENRKKYLHNFWPNKIFEPLYGIDMYNKLYNCNITLNIHTDILIENCGNYRMFEATGLGSCLITEHKENIKDLFEPDNEVVTYKSLEELKDKLRILDNDKELCKKISDQGQKKTLNYHTLNSRLEFVDKEIKKLLN